MYRAGTYAPEAIYVLPSQTAGAALQSAIEQSMVTGRPVQLLPGDYIIDTHAAANQDQFEALLGGSGGSWGAGKTLVIRGAGPKTIIRAGIASEHFFRFTASRTSPMRLLLSDFVVEAGAMASVRPIFNIRSCTVGLDGVDIRGSYDLTSGGGWTLVGNCSGWMNNCGAYNVTTAFVNVGTGLDSGDIVEEGQHAYSLSIHRFNGRNCVGHGINIHGSYDSSITECKLYHDIARFGYNKSNAGLRGGNGGRRVRWENNTVYGFYRGAQIHDYIAGLISGNTFSHCGSPGIVAGEKDYPASGLRIANNVVDCCARLVGRDKPASDSDDPDSDDTNSVGSEAVGMLITGGEDLYFGGTVESDYRHTGMGTITWAAGDTTGTLVDSTFQGNGHHGLSRNFPGDIIYLDDDGDTPSFQVRLATTGGIGSRVYKTETDGSGQVMDTVAYLADPPARVQEELVVATITGITRANPGVVTTSAPHGFNTGKSIFISGVVGMTQVNNTWFTVTSLSSTTFSIGVNTSSYTAWSSGGRAQKGPGSITQTLTSDAPALHTMSAAAFRVRRLEEKEITTGVSDIPGMAAATGGTLAWVPLQEPMYFNPGPTGSTISVGTGDPTVTGSSSPAFSTAIDPRIDDGSVVVLYGLVSGRWATIGVVSSVTTDTELELTGNGLRSYSGQWAFSVENKMRYGYILGDQTAAENRARRTILDRSMAIRGHLINYGHTYTECIASAEIASKTFTIPAQTISASKHFILSPVIPRGRQRIAEVKIAFGAAVTGDLTNFVNARVQRIRSGTATTITGMDDVELTDTAKTLGERVTITGPSPTNDEIADADLIKVNQQDHISINLYPDGTGGAIPELLVTVYMEWW